MDGTKGRRMGRAVLGLVVSACMALSFPCADVFAVEGAGAADGSVEADGTLAPEGGEGAAGDATEGSEEDSLAGSDATFSADDEKDQQPSTDDVPASEGAVLPGTEGAADGPSASGAENGTSDESDPLDADPSAGEQDDQTDPKTEQRKVLDQLASEHRGDLADGTYNLRIAGSDTLLLDVVNGSKAEGAAVQLYQANGTDAQSWEISHDEDGYVVIKSTLSGLVLGINGDTLDTSSELRLWENPEEDASGGYGLKWIALKNEDGSFALVSALDQTYALGVVGATAKGGASVGLLSQSDGSAQLSAWTVEEAQTLDERIDTFAAAHADDLPDGTYVMYSGVGSSMVLDVKSASTANSANVQVYSFNGTGAQQWKVTHDEGYVVLTNVKSGKVLDVASGKTANGTNVQQYDSNDSDAQRWIAVKEEGGVRLHSALGLNIVLDVHGGAASNGTNVQVWTGNGSVAQLWKPENQADMRSRLDELAAQNKDALDSNATYLIQLGVGSRKVVDVKSGSKSDGANVQSYASNMTAAQQWRVTKDSQGYVTFTNVGSGKVLNVASGSCVPKTNVNQATAASGEAAYAQKWIVVPKTAGKPEAGCTVYSALYPDIVLDVSGASTANGANIQIYSANGSAAQTFSFVSTAPSVAPCDDILPEGWHTIGISSNPSYVLDVASGSKENGANVQLYAGNGSLAQLYRFDYRDGYYTIVSACSGKALDVEDGNLLPPANIQIWAQGASSPNKNQQFSVTDNGDGTYTFISRSTALALDVNGGKAANGSNVQAYTPNGSAAQKFKLGDQASLLKEGTYKITPVVGSWRALDVKNGSTAPGASLQMYSDNSTLAQKWQVSAVEGKDNTYTLESLGSGLRLTAWSDGRVTQEAASDSEAQQWVPDIAEAGSVVLRNADTGKVLDIKGASTASGAVVQTYAANGSDAQRFYFTTVYQLASEMYAVQALRSPSMVVEVSGGSFSNGAKVQLYKSNDTGAQKWNITRNGDGTYTIVNAMTGSALDVKNGSAYSGATVQQYAKNGSTAQKWYVTYEGGGGFKIASALNRSFVLDISGGSYTNKTAIRLYADNGSDAQRFSFKKTTYDGGTVLGVSRERLVNWLSSHENDRYYLGTRYSSGFSISTCMYPNGAPRSDGFTGMNCTGFVAHAYKSVGGDLNAVARNNNHSPWAGGPGGGSYINAWRWYGYAIDSGAEVYTFRNVSAMLASGKAEKGDIIFFKTDGSIDCHIGFFWGNSPSQNRMWHQILPGNLISTCYNNANHAEINQQTILIKGRR